MQNHEESVFVHFIRAAVLLFALIALPGIAVCWNFLPKNCSHSIFFNENETEQQNNHSINSPLPQKILTNEVSFNESGKTPELPILPTDPFANRSEKNNFAHQPAYNTEINTAEKNIAELNGIKGSNKGEIKPAAVITNDRSEETQIPAAFVPSPAEWASAVASNAETDSVRSETDKPAAASIPLSGISPQELSSDSKPVNTDYPALEKELNALGAKYYRLEKWGRQGDLFRFSCYVSPDSELTYQKYFQAIDADEIRVMQRVVNEIKQWKNNVR